MPIWVTKCLEDRWVAAEAVPCKGTGHRDCARRLADTTLQSVFPKLLLKSDGANPIWDLKRAASRLVREETNVDVIPEDTHAYVSKKRGTAEQAVDEKKYAYPKMRHRTFA